MYSKILLRWSTFSCLTLLLVACGGGGGGSSNGNSGNTPNYTTPTPSASISLSANKGYVGESITVSWSSTNTGSCAATNAWTASTDTSGSETITPDSAGLLTFEISCSGDGGSDSASVSLQVFQYDKLTDSVSNKNWDASGTAIITQGMFEGNGFLTDFDYSGDADNLLTMTAFEPSDGSFELGFSGSTENVDSFDFDLVSADWDNTDQLLYDPDDPSTASYALINATYSDATADGFLTLPNYLITRGIDYVAATSVEILTDPSYYLFSTSIGDRTKADDLPLSGTSRKILDTLGYYYEATADSGSASSGYVIADGHGELNFDFSNSTVNGSLTYDTFVSSTSFRDGDSTYNPITSISNKTISLQNGTISGNKFSAEVVLSNNSTASQTIQVNIEANANGPGNVYVIDGVQKKSLDMIVGTTYTINHAGVHPLRFSTTNDGTHNGGSDYTTGVTTANGVTTIEITSDTPSTLYYYCQAHSGMGADINVSSSGISSGTGTVEGYFYGPNADEIGLSVMLYDDDTNESDFFILTAGGIGQTQ